MLVPSSVTLQALLFLEEVDRNSLRADVVTHNAAMSTSDPDWWLAALKQQDMWTNLPKIFGNVFHAFCQTGSKPYPKMLCQRQIEG